VINDVHVNTIFGSGRAFTCFKGHEMLAGNHQTDHAFGTHCGIDLKVNRKIEPLKKPEPFEMPLNLCQLLSVLRFQTN
jgi:hypothetical protein